MSDRRPIVVALAIWLGLFMAVLMPLHAYSHGAVIHGSHRLCATADKFTDHSDICSICKALSHLSLVHAEVVAIDLHRSPTMTVDEQAAVKPSHGFLSLSPRSPPIC